MNFLTLLYHLQEIQVAYNIPSNPFSGQSMVMQLLDFGRIDIYKENLESLQKLQKEFNYLGFETALAEKEYNFCLSVRVPTPATIKVLYGEKTS